MNRFIKRNGCALSVIGALCIITQVANSTQTFNFQFTLSGSSFNSSTQTFFVGAGSTQADLGRLDTREPID